MNKDKEYEWILNENELSLIHEGDIGDYIKCPFVINTAIKYDMDEINNLSVTPNNSLSWNLSVYPNGRDQNTSQFSFFALYTRSIPSDICEIFMTYKVTIKQLNFIFTEHNISISNKHLLHMLNAQNMLKSFQLYNCKTITIQIIIKIDKIIPKTPYLPNKMRPNPPKYQYPISKQSTYTTPFDEQSTFHEHKDNDGHDDNKSNEYYEDENEFECYPSWIIPSFGYILRWDICKSAYGKFLHCNMGESFETQWFHIEQFKFKLAAFPCGHKEEFQGWTVIYLDIYRIPENVKNIQIHCDFSCLQTKSRGTLMRHLNNGRLGTAVWNPKSLKLSTLKNLASPYMLSFILRLNIVCIEYYEKPINSHFQNVSIYKNIIDNNQSQYKYKNKQFCNESCNLIWKLNNNLINNIINSDIGQSFNSQQFDIWIIRLFPKGINFCHNKFYLSLKLLKYYLHRDIKTIVVQIIVKCEKLKIEWNDIATFNRSNSCFQWDIDHMLSCNDLWNILMNKEKIISFEFKIKVIKLFRNDNKEIDDIEKYKYLNKQCDESKMMSMIRELQQELKQTKSELIAIKQKQPNIRNVQENDNEKDDVKGWFKNIVKLPQYFDRFIENGFEDLMTISEIKEQDLIDMNIDKKGHRIKLLKLSKTIVV